MDFEIHQIDSLIHSTDARTIGSQFGWSLVARGTHTWEELWRVDTTAALDCWTSLQRTEEYHVVKCVANKKTIIQKKEPIMKSNNSRAIAFCFFSRHWERAINKGEEQNTILSSICSLLNYCRMDTPRRLCSITHKEHSFSKVERNTHNASSIAITYYLGSTLY